MAIHNQLLSHTTVHVDEFPRGDSFSSSTSVATDSQTVHSNAFTFTSSNCTYPTISPCLKPARRNDNMTVYYHYDVNGKLQSTSAEDPFESRAGAFERNHFLQRGDLVGAYLAQRDSNYPAYASPEAYNAVSFATGPGWNHQHGISGFQHTIVRQSDQEQTGDSYMNQVNRLSADSPSAGQDALAVHSAPHLAYPNPEDIRHLHTLHSLLPWIDPERRVNALSGSAVDIVEDKTGRILVHDVSKKLLVLFLGRSMVTKYLKSVSSGNDDRFDGIQKIQKMFIPAGVSSVAALRILLSWWSRACKTYNLSMIRQFDIPHNVFAACTLAQTLTLFGLHKDALRVDYAIAYEHFKRPIFPDELEQLWNCLGPSNRYNYAVIKVVGKRLREWELGDHKTSPFPKPIEMLQLLEAYPSLNARVRDPMLNEQFRPSFSTDWCAPTTFGPQSHMAHNGYQTQGFNSRFVPQPPTNDTAQASFPLRENPEMSHGSRQMTTSDIIPDSEGTGE